MNKIKFNAIAIPIILGISIGFSIIYFTEGYKKPETIIKEREVIMQDKEYYKGLALNELIKIGIQEGDTMDIVDIYQKKTNSYEMIFLIMMKAIEYDIPVNILFALIEVESEFNPKAVSEKGAIGLMQLMPQYFKQHTKDELSNIYTNVDEGCKHLRDRYDKYGKKWINALFYYYGDDKKVPHEALNYVAKVLAKENEYDDYFNEEYKE